jgi:hypothetical protein
MKQQITDNFPFLSCVKSNDKEYVGIIINCDQHVLSMYDLSMITDQNLKSLFLELGEIWWWESNRKIPIQIFLKKEFFVFRSYIKTFNYKDIEILFGPVVNLSEIAEKRVKRKTIQLVRSIKNSQS